MRKLVNTALLCVSLAVLLWCGTWIADRQRLNEDLIRLHVVANSDSDADQQLKLKVRDAVVSYVSGEMSEVQDTQEAKAYLQANLQSIRGIAENVLLENGIRQKVEVSMCKEAFDTRMYDTFTLPAGVYNALRITIGEADGKNWWCVVFPTLCMGATSEEFEDIAAGAGFPDSLTGALTGEKEYELRFFLLDALGKLENILFRE